MSVLFQLWPDITIGEYNSNIMDGNRTKFFLTPLQQERLLTKDAVVQDVVDAIFTRLVMDAQRLIFHYTHGRIDLLTNGYTSLKESVKLKFRVAVYKQVEYSQYGTGNTVESQNDVAYSQGTQTNIEVSANTPIYSADNLCVASKDLIDRTGINELHLFSWWPRITDLPLP